jgi:type IV secretory pathway VirB4 component
MKTLHLGYAANGVPVRLDPSDRKIHTHVIGSSGSGKSKFLEWMMRGDLRNSQGFCLVDPHGTLYNDVAAYAAHHVLDREVILLNLSKPDSVIGFNPFRQTAGADTSVQVDRRLSATFPRLGRCQCRCHTYA